MFVNLNVRLLNVDYNDLKTESGHLAFRSEGPDFNRATASEIEQQTCS